MTQGDIAIIGAGLSGLTLALALHKQSISCSVYESRSASLDIGGAVMLSPNALRILDSLEVYEKVKPKGFHFKDLHFRTAIPLDSYEFGNEEKYGAGIQIQYGKKFVRVLAETETEVSWGFEDGTTGQAACLIGADGIHSRVRKYLYPDLEPKFTNAVGVSAAVPTAQLNLPDSFDIPVTIMNPKHGAFVIAPQLSDGSEAFIGKQKRAPELDREGWAALLDDKQWCVDFLRQGAEDFPEVVQNAVSKIELDRINLWPFHVVPKLEDWTSKHCRVVILGDAAHAIPPTAGQGINQAFEDVYTFAVIFRRCRAHELQLGLKIWQQGRQERIDRILELNAQIDARRLPKPPGLAESEISSRPFDLEWLYSPNFDEMAEEWLEQAVDI
ncbi:unnamed protein product [Penicillium salamii]|nr:unnamed protein product [Penicillium salamii]